MQIDLESMAIEMPAVSRHPNRLPFRGVLTLVDVPSDQPPAGARGHRVLLTRQAAEKALPSLLGMALDYTPALDAHDAKRKVGIITSADLVESPVGSRQSAAGADGKGHGFSRAIAASLFSSALAAEGKLTTDDRRLTTVLEVSGYLFAKDFPEVVRELKLHSSRLGMSYEISDARVQDVNASVWTLTEVTFTGAAILRRDKAAYSKTWVELEEPSRGLPVVGRVQDNFFPADSRG